MTKTQALLARSRALPLFDPDELAADPDLVESFKKNRIGYSAVRGVRRLLPSACTSVDLAVVSALASVLNIDAAKALLTGWSKHAEVKEAKAHTAATPGLEEVVTLYEHHVRSTYHPTVKVYVDNVKVHTFTFDLNLDFTIEGVAVTVKEGHVAGVRSGRCQVDATLESLGVPLKEWTLELDGGVELPEGVPSPPPQRKPRLPR